MADAKRWTPVFRVVADGTDITAKIADRMVSITVTDEAGSASDKVDIELDDRGAVFEPPPTGAALTVALGYKESGGAVDMGVFVVDELEFKGPERRFRITGKAGDSLDKDAPGRFKAPQSRSWHDTTVGDVVRTVAAERGFEAVADVPSQFRAMKRLWIGKGLDGLIARREGDAVLWEDG